MTEATRPTFPKRALITGGMPYGNKDLHFGHVGGVFVPADVFARFLRDRIGAENVIFVSGTDCYGSPIVAYYQQLKENDKAPASIEDFVKLNHEQQKETLKQYDISLSFFAASALGRAKEIHQALGVEILEKLYAKGHLLKLSTPQFFDPEANCFLNGRQVLGHCPIPGCKSEQAYADECSLGHPYEPKDLINPKSVLSGKTPEMRTVSNWYLNLEGFQKELEKWVERIESLPEARGFAIKAIREFLEPPAIYLKQGEEQAVQSIAAELPEHQREETKGRPVKLIFKNLPARDKATELLSSRGLRFRSAKTLVPFRLTGNIEWGLPAPEIEDLKGLTFWVWPESLWAPISFCKTYLEAKNQSEHAWKEWWCSKAATVYQFIGEDNVFFYGPAEMGIFMGLQAGAVSSNPTEGELQLPKLVVNKHLLFFDKKASSSGKIRPPMASDLLKHYTSDQLRAHFFALGLGFNSVPFRPKPYDPKAGPKDGDPVLKEGNLLSNVLNRVARSCFYTVQKYFEGRLPLGQVSAAVIEEANTTILQYERLMYKHEFHSVMGLLDRYIRGITKFWAANVKLDDSQPAEMIAAALIDAFHMLKVSVQLVHPIAPQGSEMIRQHLAVGEELWSWEHIFEPLAYFTSRINGHAFKFLEPRVDFFPKHPSQLADA